MATTTKQGDSGAVFADSCAGAIRAAALLSVLLLISGPAAAQSSVINPTRAQFEPSADHASVTRYELSILDATGTEAAAFDLGMPVPVDGVAEAPVDLAALPFGAYTAVARAYGADANGAPIRGEDSDPSNVFVRVPGAPSGVLVIP